MKAKINEVHELLDQLGLHTHYLADKPIDSWDEYDYSNYRSLQIKGGKIRRMYAILDYSNSFNSLKEAHVESQRRIDSGTHPDHLEIRMVYVKTV